MKSNWTPRWLARIRATLVWRRFRERALLRAQRRSRRDRTRRLGLSRLDGLARLEPRMLLAADIATDQFDYAPGSTALITTFSDGGPDRNFLVGETIQFQVVRTDGIADNAPGNLPWKVTDGLGGFDAYVDETGIRIAPDRDGIADGRIETDWFVGSEYANASLEVRAFGLTSGETATEAFHDSAIVITANTAWSQITTGSGVNGAPTANDSIVVNQGVTLTIDVNGAVAGGVTVGNGAAGTATLAFSTGTIGVTFGSLASNGTARVTFNNANSTLNVGTANTSTTFAGAISGAGKLTKTGTGTLTLSGTNTYTGGTNVTGGVLASGANNVLPDTGSVTVNGGTLALGGSTDAVGAVSLLGGGSITGGAAITGGVVANPDFDAVAVTGFTKPSNASWSYTNNAYISRNGSAFGFTHTPSGTQFGILQSYRNTSSSLSQTISVATAGYVSYAFRGQGRPNYGSAGVELVIDGTVQSTWPASAFTTGAWGDYVSQPVFLEAGTHTLQFRSITHAGDVATAIDAIKLSLPGLTGSSYDLQNGSVTANLAGSGALLKSGFGTVTLSGVNTYTGGTAINGGVLALGSTGALGTAGTISFGGGTLQYSASNTTDYSSRFSTAANQTYSVDTNGQNVTCASALVSSGGSLRKSGAGTLTLTGNVTSTGGTIVSGGTLRLGASNILADSGAVTLSGGSLDLDASSDTIGSLTGLGTVTTTTGVLTVTGRLAGGLAAGNIGLQPQAKFSPSVGLPVGGATTVAGLTAAGTVDLGGSSLDLTIDGRADVGQSVMIVDNDGSDPVIGGFAGLPDGTVFLAGNGQTFRIDYAGGDGNDIVLTRVLVGLTVSSITVDPRPYDGGTIAPLNLSQATLVGLVPGDTSTALVTAGVTGTYDDPNAAYGKPVTLTGLSLTGALADNYVLLTPELSGTIDMAQVSIQGAASVVYNGRQQWGVVVGYGINGETLDSAVTNEIFIDAGVYTVTWQFLSQDQNYDYANASGTGTFTIERAAATISVTPYNVTDNGLTHTAMGVATGVNGEDLSSGLYLEGTTHSEPGVYFDSWYFISPDPNYTDVDPGVGIVNTILPREFVAPIVSLGNDTGTSTADALTFDGALSVTGVERENGIEYSLDGGHTWSGEFQAVEGRNVVLVRQFDGRGRVSPGTQFEFTLDTLAPASPGLSLANDTGSSGSDRITSDGSLSLSGVEEGTQIEYSIDGGETWNDSFTAVEGSNQVLVRQVDLAGNVSFVGPKLLALYRFDDPANAGLDSSGRGAMAVNFGASVGGEGYQDGAALFDGTGYLRSPVDVSVEALPRLTWGAWVKPTNTNPIRAVLSADDGGYDRDIDIDYRGNGVPEWSAFTGNGVVGSGVAPSPTDWVFVAAVYDEAQAVMTLYVGDTAVTATTSFGPSFNFFDIGHNPGSGEFFEGAIDNVFVYGDALTASQIADIRTQGFSGGDSASLSLEFTLDTQAAAALTVSLTSDTGASGADLLTNVADVTIGNVEPGATVEYSVDGGRSWSTSFSAVEGTNVLGVRQVDVAGNVSPGTPFEFTLDTQAAAAPTVSLSRDTGTNITDRITSVADLTIGNVEPGATVEYTVDGGRSWSTSFSAVEGTNVLAVRQFDVAGNRSPGTQFAFTLDTRILPLVPFFNGFGNLMPDGIAAVTTLDFSGCTVPLTFTVHPNGSLTVEDTRNPSANGLTFKSFGDIVGGQTTNRFVFVGSATMKGSVIGNATAKNTLDYSESSLAISVDLGTGLATGVGGFRGINVVIGSTANGNAGGNTLIGSTGGSVWAIESPGRGSVGGLLFSGINDIVAASANDTLDYSLSASAVTVNLALGAATGFRQISGFRSVIGSPFDDSLVGDTHDNTFTGLSGNDSFDGGSGIDAVVESANVDFTLAAAELTGLGTDTLAGIEAVNLTGGAGANAFTLQGWTGNSILAGGAGSDRYVFTGTGLASVTIVESANADTDTLDFTGLLNGGVSIDLAVMTAQAAATGLTLTLSTVTGIENVTGTAFADTLAGNARDNVLSGLAGDDSLSGLSGNDTFVGGAGTDTVVESGDVDFTLTAAGLAGRGNDSLTGIEGVSLTAGAGANTFTVQGWTGNSILAGAAGNDSYVFGGTGSGSVTIAESADADTDALDFTALLNGGVTIDLAVTTAQTLASGLTLTLSSATGLENVIGTAFADTLVGNARDNRVAGLAGDDTLSGRAGTDSLDGGVGVDAVVESGNIDFTLAAALLTGLGTETLVSVESVRLAGGDGANTFTLAGWTGRAELVGGAGSDRYVFRGTTAANVTLVEAADTDSDTLDFSDLASAAVNVDLASTAAQAAAAGLTLTLSSSTGIENVVGTALADTLLGNTRDNSLSGLAGNDTFTGLSGNDTFLGGAGTDTVVESADVDFTLTAAGLTGIGSDSLDSIETVNLSAGASANRFTIDSWTGSATLTGGAGNDSYVFVGTESAGVTIVEGANADTDTLDFTGLLNGGVNIDLAVTGSQTVVPGLTLRLSAVTGIEDVTGTAFADTVRGNTRNNVLSGLAGADTLVGRTGDDTFIGSAGDDSFDGGIGTDTVIESADIDFTLASTTLTGLGTDTLASIERANLTAGASANTFTVQGWTGVATLTGLTGNDRYVFSGTESASVTIVEGADADTDTLDFTALANGGVSVDLAATTAQSLVAGLTLTLSTATGIEDVTGTAFADTVQGNARDNTLAGLAGDDTLSGRLGNDTFDGGAGTDTTAESADVDFTLAAATLTGVGSDTLAGIETVNLAAGAGHNTFTVDGWTGNASLTGGAGNDSYVFTGTASANVTIVESADTDTDTLDFTTLANGGVSLDLAVTTAQAVSAGLTLTLSTATGLENVTGTALADTLLGNTRHNVLSGLAGDDTLSGRDGNDTFDGGTGSDVVTESADVDFTLAAATLTGVGNDSLASVETVNLTAGIRPNTFTVDGWTGNATLTGAAGNDRYMFSGIESATVTIVEAANTDSDTLDFANLLSGGVSIDLAVTAAQTVVSGLTLTLSSTTGIENVTGTALTDTLQGNARGNLLAGLAGDDILTGRGGNDSLDGGSGSDTVTESGNVDFTLTAAGLAGRGSDLLADIESVNLTAGVGANTITVDGWTGSAVLSGGAGDDTYVFTGNESASVTIVEAADADSDTLDLTGLLNGGVSLDLALMTAQTLVSGLTLTLSTETGLENVTGTAFADSLVGNARANTLAGLSGDDVLTGGVGDDTLDGGAGIDTVVESADVDFALASSALTGLGTDTLTDIEGAILTGGAGANSFTVNGWTGSALLSGAAGGDVYAFAGTLSATVTIVEMADADADTLDFTSFANGGVTVDLAVTTTQTAASGLTVTLSSRTGIENVTGTIFADVLLGNTLANTLSGLGGDDTLTGRAGDDTLTGGDGTDTVTESADVDFTLAAASLVGLGTDSLGSVETASLTAGGGANTFTEAGWAGAAILTGGAGNDSYVFSGTASVSVTIVEVADADTDTLDFTALAGSGVSLDLALTTAQTIVSQATLTTAQTIVSGVTLTLSSDTSIENVIGTALTDTILGNGRNNTLLGFAGDDALAGRAGDDTLVGGVGNDNLDGGDGTDTVVASADVDLTLTPTTLTGIGADTLAGIEGANLTAGSGANTFTVSDWTGSAVLDGGTGNDTYVFAGTESASVTIVEAGNADADTLDFSGLSNGGVNLDLAATTAQTLVAGLTATLSSATGIENVVGTAFADTILGNARDNTLLGIAGDDELAGRAGDDTFTGGAGDDRFDGGAGTDTLVESADLDFTLTAAGLVGRGTDSLAGIETVSLTAGSEANTFTVAGWTGSAILSGAAGNDRYVFSGTESVSVTIVEGADTDADTLDFTGLLNGGVTIDLAATMAQTLVAGLTLTLSSAGGIENVTGTAFADTLAGNSRDNSLSGLAGDDTFSGLAGNDTFVGGTGTDTVVASADVDFTLSPTTLAGLGSDTLAGIEEARLTAGSGANTFTVQSWTGSAILSGGAGNDTYVFSGTASASVTIVEADDADTDALDFSSLLNGGVNLDLAVTTAQTLVAGLTVVLSSATGIENVVGTAFADTVVGNARDNTLAGLAGDDTLAGRGGDDTFTGGAGNDAFAGGDGIDTVVDSADVDFTLTPTTLTGVGSDTLAEIEGANLTAGSGVNTFTVNAWTGSAILSGAAGNDAYVFTGSESASVTIIEAADADTDSLDFTNLANGGVNLDLAATTAQTLVAGLTLTISSATGLENVIGTALADTIVGNARANTLSGVAGDDTLAGRAGDDRYVFAGALLASVMVVESADADADTLDFSGISNGGLALDLGVDTPQSIATGLTVTLSTATGLENAIGTVFADTLVGNTRDNTFSGLAGDDRLDGGAGTDTVVESGDVDFTLTPTTLSGVGSDTLAGIEAARLMAGAGANIFTVNAWAGSATLTGDAGSDRYVFVGAVSASIAIVEESGANTDTLDFSALSLGDDTGVSVDLALTASQSVTATLTLTLSDATGIENVTGTAAADTMLGNARDNAIAALGGDDTLAGRAGSNTLDGGAGSDTVIETGIVDATVTAATITGVGSDVLVSIEVVDLVGGDGANTFTVDGWGGSLILAGGLGNDSYVFVGGTSTSVRVVEVANADADTLDFSAVTLTGGAGLTVDLAVTTQQEVTDGLFVTLFDGEGIENVVGSNAADTMSGNGRNNVFRGLLGQDTIDGRDGTDTFVKAFGLVNVIVNDSSLIGSGTDSFSNIEVVNVTLGPDPSDSDEVGLDGRILDASTFNGTLIADFGTDSLEITRSTIPSGLATSTLILPALLESLSVVSGTIYLGAEINTGATGSVSLDSSGAIIDDNDPETTGTELVVPPPINNIIASRLVLRSVGGIVGGIGMDDILDTQVSFLSLTNSGSGDVSVLNQKNVPGAVDIVEAVNSAGSVAVENYGDDTRGITVSGAVRSKGIVSLISHSPLTIDGSIQSTSGSEITLEADTLTMTKTSKIVTTGDVAMNSRVVSLTDADMADAKIKNSRSDAQIDVSGGSFNTLTSTGKGSQIDVRGGAFKTLTATGKGSQIDVRGGSFDVLNTSDVDNIDVSGGIFKTLNASGAGKIDVAGGSFEELITSGSGALGISDGSFRAVTIRGTSGIDVRGGKFGVLTNSSSGSIDVRGGDFEELVASGTGDLGITDGSFRTVTVKGSGAIDVRGGKFSVGLGSSGAGKISVSGGDFEELIASGSGELGITDGAFKMVKVSGSGGIDIRGGKFSVGLGSSGAGKISVSGGDFEELIASGSGDLGITDGSFKMVKVSGSGGIDVRGGNFEVLSSSGEGAIDVSGGKFSVGLGATGAGKISVKGGDFDQLFASGTGDLGITDGSFKMVKVSGSGGIDVRGGNFEVLSSSGEGAIDVSGGKFTVGMGSSGAGKINVKGGDFDQLFASGTGDLGITAGSFKMVKVSGSGGIDVRGGNFEVLSSSGEGAIDVSGGKFSVGLGSSGAGKISVSGGDFDQLFASGTGDLGITDGSFKMVTVVGSGTIDVRGGKFGVLSSNGAGGIDVRGGKFTVGLGSSGAAKINVSGGDFDQLVASGSGDLGISDGSFKTVTVTGSGAIDVRGGKFSVLSSSGAGKIAVNGGSFTTLNASGSGEIAVTDGKFNTLNASGSGGIDIRGGAFKVGVNSTGSGNKISVAGADMVSLRNSGAGSTITVGSTRFESITNDADNVTLAVVGDSGSNALINSGNDVTISFAAGAGDDVFVNDGRGDDDYGARVALTIDLGDGRDRAVLGGTALAGSIAGGSGDDTVLFVDGVTGTLALDEIADLDTDTLDFSSLSIVGGVGVAVDLALTTTQVVKSGLSLTLTSGSGFENAVGSSGADSLRGNSRDNALFGSDLPDDRLGAAATSNGRVQLAYLEFDSETDASVGDHVYTSDERAAIATRLASIYSAFSVQFVLDEPALGEYVTIKFNKPRPGSEDSGGWASEVDFGNRSYSGIATVDVNGLLGVPGGPVATSEHFVASSSWLAAHELSHLLGLRHADSFGPPGFGIAAPPGRSGYYNNPEYVGPSAAWETDRHIIETPALTGFTLWDLVAVQFFGEREAIKLVYNDMAPITPDGKLLVEEQATPHDTRSLSGAQELLPVPLSLPNTLNHGLNAAKDLMAGAVAVLGELTATAELDLYRIAGRRGDLLNIQVMSSALDRYKQSSSSLDLDAVLTVYDAAGIVVSLSDDEFETRDPSIIDLVLPADGIYYIEVKGFYHDDGQAADTGRYELFLSRFEAASVNDAGDILEGRGGNDTLAGGRGDDTYVFQGTGLGTDAILEDVRLEKSGLGATGSVDGRDSGDTLDFTNFGSAVSIDLASTAVQVVAAGDLSLRLSSAVESADEPSAARGLERVLGSALGNTVAGNARANTFDGGGSVNAFQGADAADTFQLGGGLNTVDGGTGADAVTLPGSKADYTIAISGSTVTVSSLPGVVPASESILTSVEVVRFRGDGTATLVVGVGDGFASVQAAVNAAAAGDTILVAPGSYSGAIDLDKDELTLVSAAGNEATTLLGAGATATVTVSASGVIVRGFGIDNAGVAGGSAILIRSSADVTVDGNVIRNAVSGVAHVDDGGSAGAVITGNTFASTVQSGIASTVNLVIAGLSGNTFRTSGEAINLGSGVSLAGNALDRAGIFALIDAQSIDLSGGAAVVDSRSSTTYAVVAPSVAEYQQTVGMAPSTGLAGAATFAVVAGVDAGLFQIDGATGLLRFANRPRYTAPADVGADNVAEVIVRATDGTRNVVTRYTVSVVDVNVAPEFAAATRVVNLAENLPIAGVAAATDWDLDTLGYSIAADATDNADGALFTLHPVTGVLTFQVAPDFENPTDADRDGIYQVRVAATDPGGLVSHQIVTVVVSDTNDNAPVFTSAATATVAENTAVSAVVYTATRTDADATAAYRNVSYSIKTGAGDGARVAVNAASGAVTLLTPADYETKTSYLFVVVADDGVNRSERIVTLNVIDTNDNAPVITSAATGSVVENAATTAVIYTGLRTDADVTAAFRQVSYSVKPAVGDAAMVAIQSTTGAVTLLASADYETKTSYVFTIIASDGLNTTEKSVTVNVVDANDSAPVITSGAAGSVTENAATTTVIYTVTRTDADVTAAFRQVTYSVKPAVGDAARVAINATTGAVTLLAAANFEVKTSYQFTIIASDGRNATEQAVTVNVIDTNDNAPVITSATTGTVAENAATSTVIYTVTRTDADVTAAFRNVSYSIKPLVGDAARVTLHPATGAVTLLAPADFETKTSYLFTVVASDGINRTEKAVTVSVTDRNDNAPVITSAAVGSVTENAVTTTVIYTATRTDADVTAAFRLVTYSIKPLVGDAARVAINAATGAVTLLAAADYETKTSYVFTVVASDGVNSAEKAVTVSVVNVDDTAATFTSGRTASVVASATLNPLVYTATVNDSTDVSQGVAFSLAAADATLFAIDATTGVVTVKGSTLAMKGKVYTFTVTATDKGGLKKAVSQLITLTVT
jgi:autotransporter-associated beta strand protein